MFFKIHSIPFSVSSQGLNDGGFNVEVVRTGGIGYNVEIVGGSVVQRGIVTVMLFVCSSAWQKIKFRKIKMKVFKFIL